MEPNKKFVAYVLSALLTALLITVGIICYESYHAAKSAGNDFRRTISDVKTDSSSARHQLDDTQSQLSAGQKGLRNAENTAGSVEKRVESSAGIIESSQLLIDEIRAEFADIDRANGISPEETGNERTAK